MQWKLRSALVFIAGSLSISTASAQSGGGLFRDLYQGLQYGATPIGRQTTPLVNGSRVGQLRVVPNRLGDGYRVEFDRNFGNDQFGRPEVFDAGPFEVQLSGAVQATASYTDRFFPIGNLDVQAQNLQYTVRAKTGAQDATVTGTLNVASNVEVNPFGFYTLNLNVANTNSQLDASGLAVSGTDDTDFNVGPISVKGNVFWDVGVGALAALGIDTTSLEQVFPSSPIGQINDQIRNALGIDLAATTADASGAKALDTANSLDFASRYPQNSALVAIVTQIAEAQFAAGLGQTGSSPAVPEPGSVLLLAVGGLAAFRRR